MSSSQLLLKNGTVVIHETRDFAKGVKADVLIRGNKIARIGPSIQPFGEGVEVIDCTDKIVAPGFIDTHRHMWNIALRGRHGNNLLTDYISQGILQSSNYSPEDVFWGQLASCMEAIDAGTTTVVDHSHLNYSPDHPKAAISATVASGVRSIYGYCFTGRVDSWSPFTMNPNLLEPWILENLKDIASKVPLGDGRVTLGIAFDLWFLPKEMLVPLFESIRNVGVTHLTTHCVPRAPGQPSTIEIMESCGLLSSSAILSHANHLSPNDIELIKKRNASISSTPTLELQMAMGTPACFDSARDLQSCSSLGVDCHNVTLPSMPAEMRVALQNSRGVRNQEFLAKGKLPRNMYKTVQEVYCLGTIAGAKAVGMESQLGSLEEGKLADIVVFDALSPSMICGAQHDPVTALVMHSTPRDVVMTIVDGIIRKRAGSLEPVELSPEAQAFGKASSATMGWPDVAKQVLRTRDTVQQKIEKIDMNTAGKSAMKVFGIDDAYLSDTP